MTERLKNIGAYIKTGAEMLLSLPFLSFTQGQKEWIHERDQNQCQARGIIPHKCVKEKHVHHLMPQRYASENGVEPDFAENGITICLNAHQSIHPDMIEARLEYIKDQRAFEKMFDRRKQLLDARTIYWIPTWDRALSARAIRNTQKFRKEHPEKPWPEKHPRNGHNGNGKG